ncbi:MAG: flagellar export chaperone FlgN [Phycisphaeraceae bacterium]|nr:flagellar export chaperone FlgN [Phycisphaeraceae bacterium]
MNQTDIGGRVLEMLAEQHDLLAKVGELCLAQGRVIEEDEPEQLVAVLEQRSKVLARATTLSREIDQGVQSMLRDDPQMGLIQQRRRAVADLAHTIAETDRQHGAMLSRKRDELARTLAGMNSGRAAAAAYSGGREPIGPGFQDQSV